MIKFNKILWWIPIVGIFYTLYVGFKYGFLTEISNPLKLWEGIIGGLIHGNCLIILLMILFL